MGAPIYEVALPWGGCPYLWGGNVVGWVLMAMGWWSGCPQPWGDTGVRWVPLSMGWHCSGVAALDYEVTQMGPAVPRC